MVRYLLGDLTEEEQVQIEELFFTDNQYFEQLRSVEDALIDDYAQGILTEYERGKVEGLLLSSPRQAREIEFVRDLIGYTSENAPELSDEQNSNQLKRHGKRGFLIGKHGKRLSLAVAALLILSILFMAIWNLTLQSKIRQMEARQEVLEKSDQELQQQIDKQKDNRESIVKELESERRKRDEIEKELAALQEAQPQISRDEIAFLDLKTDSFSRGGGELKTVLLRPDLVRFQIRISLGRENDYKSYSAVIRTFDGREIRSKDQLSPSKTNLGKLVITLPASIFTNDDYILTLKGQNDTGSIIEIGDFSFRVKR